MSCRSTPGSSAAIALARKASGLSDKTVQGIFHSLKRNGEGLPPPDQDTLDDWRGQRRDALDRLYDINDKQRDTVERRLWRARSDNPEGGHFYAMRRIEAVARQHALVVNTDAAVPDFPEENEEYKDYERGPDGRPTHVWYASYGSNMNRERFMAYIKGGGFDGNNRDYDGARDSTEPTEDTTVILPGQVHYAMSSGVWGGGIAFLDDTADGESLGRAYKITIEQFDDVVAQENGDRVGSVRTDVNAALLVGRKVGTGTYGTLVHTGDIDGVPVMTFTSSQSARSALHEKGFRSANEPSPNYLKTIGLGLQNAYGFTDKQTVDYLLGGQGTDRVSRSVAKQALHGTLPSQIAGRELAAKEAILAAKKALNPKPAKPAKKEKEYNAEGREIITAEIPEGQVYPRVSKYYSQSAKNASVASWKATYDADAQDVIKFKKEVEEKRKAASAIVGTEYASPKERGIALAKAGHAYRETKEAYEAAVFASDESFAKHALAAQRPVTPVGNAVDNESSGKKNRQKSGPVTVTQGPPRANREGHKAACTVRLCVCGKERPLGSVRSNQNTESSGAAETIEPETPAVSAVTINFVAPKILEPSSVGWPSPPEHQPKTESHLKNRALVDKVLAEAKARQEANTQEEIVPVGKGVIPSQEEFEVAHAKIDQFLAEGRAKKAEEAEEAETKKMNTPPTSSPAQETKPAVTPESSRQSAQDATAKLASSLTAYETAKKEATTCDEAGIKIPTLTTSAVTPAVAAAAATVHKTNTGEDPPKRTLSTKEKIAQIVKQTLTTNRQSNTEIAPETTATTTVTATTVPTTTVATPPEIKQPARRRNKQPNRRPAATTVTTTNTTPHDNDNTNHRPSPPETNHFPNVANYTTQLAKDIGVANWNENAKDYEKEATTYYRLAASALQSFNHLKREAADTSLSKTDQIAILSEAADYQQTYDDHTDRANLAYDKSIEARKKLSIAKARYISPTNTKPKAPAQTAGQQELPGFHDTRRGGRTTSSTLAEQIIKRSQRAPIGTATNSAGVMPARKVKDNNGEYYPKVANYSTEEAKQKSVKKWKQLTVYLKKQENQANLAATTCDTNADTLHQASNEPGISESLRAEKIAKSTTERQKILGYRNTAAHYAEKLVEAHKKLNIAQNRTVSTPTALQATPTTPTEYHNSTPLYSTTSRPSHEEPTYPVNNGTNSQQRYTEQEWQTIINS